MTLIRAVAKLLCSGLGSGYSPVAPGTLGSIAFLVLWWAAQQYGFVPHGVLFDTALAILIAVAGTVAVAFVLREETQSDPQWIVIDEWAGMAFALIATPPDSYIQTFSALILFRIFDVWKPGLIGRAEGLPRAYGIMADDIVGGVCALIVLRSVVLLAT